MTVHKKLAERQIWPNTSRSSYFGCSLYVLPQWIICPPHSLPSHELSACPLSLHPWIFLWSSSLSPAWQIVPNSASFAQYINCPSACQPNLFKPVYKTAQPQLFLWYTRFLIMSILVTPKETLGIFILSASSSTSPPTPPCVDSLLLL